jgi:hypothetical protein
MIAAMAIVRAGAVATPLDLEEYRDSLHRREWADAREIDREMQHRRESVDVEIEEFVDLADGRRIMGEEQLGYSGSGVRQGDDFDPWLDETRASIEESVRVVLTRDGDTGHGRWWRLLRTLEASGIATTADELDAAPFAIVLSDALTQRLTDSRRA